MKTVKSGKTIAAILGAFAVALLIKGLLLDCVIVEGSSMEPSLHNGEAVVVFRAAYGLRMPWGYLFRWAEPHPGDVVVFITPSGEHAVKRCSRLLQSDRFYALGDNADESYDSRSYGPVSTAFILGKVLGI